MAYYEEIDELEENPLLMDEEAVDMAVQRVAWLRAMQLWFHGAHHIVKGISFSGDHTNLYQRIYVAIQEEVDGATEKVVGITGDDSTACPHMLARRALKIMDEYPSPTELSALGIAQAGLQMEIDYMDFAQEVFDALGERDMLTLGLNDQIAASVNAHETFKYLLQQRVKQEERSSQSE